MLTQGEVELARVRHVGGLIATGALGDNVALALRHHLWRWGPEDKTLSPLWCQRIMILPPLGRQANRGSLGLLSKNGKVGRAKAIVPMCRWIGEGVDTFCPGDFRLLLSTMKKPVSFSMTMFIRPALLYDCYGYVFRAAS
ncbi:hypothetical protein Fmac_028296 [Flemingia macrophylla]|uniref:Uncharacterized protein n=1 Tax=Flemingia macrophylla TaxID=520843 RepID=A0ABD1L743_9FABA